MSTTIYTSADISNIVKTQDFPPDSCTDTGTGINLDFNGTDSGTLGRSCGFFTKITGDYNHATPVTPIPTNAHITKIELTYNVQYDLSASATGGTATVSSEYDAGNFFNDTADSPFPTAWITTDNKLSVSVTDNTGSMNSSVDSGPTGVISSCIIDITLLPGLFPLGYMDYATFLTYFSQFWFWQTANCGSSKTFPGTGTGSASLSVQTTNFTMEVTWDAPFLVDNITIPNKNITVTDPVFDIETTADPSITVPPGSVGVIDKISFGDPTTSTCIMTQASPWIVSWWLEVYGNSIPPVMLKHITRLRVAMCALQQDNVDVWVYVNNAVIPDGSGGGTSFSGWVSIGTLVITYADLSGIYRIDGTVHNDTLYDRTNTASITTTVYPIPAPYLVTAFIGDAETDILHYTGTRMRVTGSGLLGQIFQSYDTVNTYQMVDITILGANNVNPFTIANFLDQFAALRVLQYGDTTTDYFNISKIIIFQESLFTDYPQ